MMADFILGIDLGTTNSCVAVHFDGATEIIPDPDGFTTVPSVVHIAADGTRTFGRQALDRRAHDPAATIYGAKRLIGRPADADEIRDLQRYFAYTIVADDGGELAVEVHGQRYSVIDISAWLLEYLRSNAESWLEQPVTRAVISVPAYFNQRQRDAVQEAGRRAGLDVLRIINEPTAAALAYRAGRQDHRRILVYDLGGGTFDVTVLELRDRVFEVLATGGDSFLGGLDFDRAIAERLRQRFETREGVHIASDQAAMQRLMRAAEQAKIDAGADGQAHVKIPFLAKAGQPLPRRLGIDDRCSLDDLGQWTEDLIAQTLIICDEVLVEAGMVASEIDEVVLVGGMTRFPPVRARVTAHFGVEPHTGLNPDEVVAAGAAILGDALVRPSEAIELVDVLPVSIGMTVNYGPYQTVLHRNTRIPALVERDLPTTVDGQTGLAVHLYQGESPNPADNTWLGELVITGIEPRPAGEISVRLRLALDENGLLDVQAHEASTGQRLEQRFATTPPVEVAQVVTARATETDEPPAAGTRPEGGAPQTVHPADDATPAATVPEPPAPVDTSAAVTTDDPPDIPVPPVAATVTAETPPATAPESPAPVDTSADVATDETTEIPEPPVAETVTAETPPATAPESPAPVDTSANVATDETTEIPEPPVAETVPAATPPATAPEQAAPQVEPTEQVRLRDQLAATAETLAAANSTLDELDRMLRRLGGDPEIVWSGYAMLRGQLAELRDQPPAFPADADLDSMRHTIERYERLSREWQGLEAALRAAIAAQQEANAARIATLRKELQQRLDTLETRYTGIELPDDKGCARLVEALDTQIEEARQVVQNALASDQRAAVEAAARQFALTEKQIEETIAEIQQFVVAERIRRETAATERLNALRQTLQDCQRMIAALEKDIASLPDADRSELQQRVFLLRDDTLKPGGMLARAAADPTAADLDEIEGALSAVEEGVHHIREDLIEIQQRERRARIKTASAKLRKVLERLEVERGLLRDRLARARGLADDLGDAATAPLKTLAEADQEAASAVQQVRELLESLSASPANCDPVALEQQAAALLARIEKLHRATDGAVEKIEAAVREAEERRKKRGALGRISLRRVRSDGENVAPESDTPAPAESTSEDAVAPATDELFETQAPTLADEQTTPSEQYQDISQLLTIETPEPTDEDDFASLVFTEEDFGDDDSVEIVDLTPTAAAPVADVVESDDHIDPDAFVADLVAHGLITSDQLARADELRAERTPDFREFAITHGHIDKDKAALIEREQAMLERQYDYKTFAETAIYLGLMREEDIAAIERKRLATGPSLESLLVELGFIDRPTLERERQRFLRQQSGSALQQLPLPENLQRPPLVRLLVGIVQKQAAQLSGLQLAPEVVPSDTPFDAYATASFTIHGELNATCELRADYAATYLLATALNPALGMVDDLDPELLKEQFTVFVQQLAEETGQRLAQIRGHLQTGEATGGPAVQSPVQTAVQIQLGSPRGTIVLGWHETMT